MRRRASVPGRQRYENGDRHDFFSAMSPWAALRAVVIFVYVFMLGPILITAAVSFNASNRSQFPPRGFSPHGGQRRFSPDGVDRPASGSKLPRLAAPITT